MNNNNSKISVVCPTYNSEKYIEKAIKSLLSQDVKPDEVIFSDDGSKDKTVNIIKKYQTPFEKKGIAIKIIINTHSGPGGARNSGIKQSSFSWIAFIDSDDIWYSNKISLVKNSINQNPKKNCFLHWEKLIKTNGEVIDLKHGELVSSDRPLENQLYKSNFFSTSAIVCSKSLIIDSGYFDTSLPNAQDYDLWLKMSPNIKLEILEDFLGEYIEQNNSISSRSYIFRIGSQLRLIFRHRKKGTIYLFFFKIIRLFVTKQWFNYKL